MLKWLLFFLILSVATKLTAQDTTRLFNYHIGFHLTYVGDKSPDFTLPFGGGITLSSTFNKLSRFKPTIEASLVHFPTFVIRIFNSNNSDKPDYSYEVYSLLVGTKFRLNNLFKIGLTAGPTLNSIEDMMQLAVKPSFEINSKGDKFIAQFYCHKVANSDIINGYAGISLTFRLR